MTDIENPMVIDALWPDDDAFDPQEEYARQIDSAYDKVRDD